MSDNTTNRERQATMYVITEDYTAINLDRCQAVRVVGETVWFEQPSGASKQVECENRDAARAAFTGISAALQEQWRVAHIHKTGEVVE